MVSCSIASGRGGHEPYAGRIPLNAWFHCNAAPDQAGADVHDPRSAVEEEAADRWFAFLSIPAARVGHGPRVPQFDWTADRGRERAGATGMEWQLAADPQARHHRRVRNPCPLQSISDLLLAVRIARRCAC